MKDRKDAQITELQDQLLNALRRLSESDLERQNLEQRIVEFERRETERSFAALDADERQAVGLLRAMETEQARCVSKIKFLAACAKGGR
ncbi:hypothetical protein DIPPA_06805 [Diplonema papillatum]|nr:hypothetical protein DIPPA_06805 [Diplonema papillatum]